MFFFKTVKATTRQLLAQLKMLVRGDFILIYQMGKVGSTALERTLSNSLHFHTLYNRPHCEFRARLKWGWFGTRILMPIAYFCKRLAIRRGRKVKIITLVRDPVARARSVFFQELPYWLVLYFNKRGLDERQEGVFVLDEAFGQEFNIDYYDSWFDEELKRFTGIDVFEQEFDADQGYALLTRGKYEVLLIQYEKLSEVQEQIESFAGQAIDLTRENVSTNKWYGPILRNFTEEHIAQLPGCEQLSESRTSRYFGYSANNDGSSADS